MDHDEKQNSHEDETPPVTEGEANAKEDRPEDELPEQIETAAEKPRSSHEPFGFTRSRSSSSGWGDADYGMPDFNFPSSPPSSSRTTFDKADTGDALDAARATLDSPLQEDTGWRNTSSIEKPEETEAGASEASGDGRPFRGGQAKVMPFPTSAIQRSTEPTPSEMLRGGAAEEDTTVFGSPVAEPVETAAEFEPEAHDALADAVQSALRNVYGGRSATAAAREPAPDFENYTVGESLKQAAAAERGRADQGWAASPEWREESQEGYFEPEAEPDSPDLESNTDAVLDYLYTQRRGGGRENTVLSADASLRDFGEASGFGRDWQDPSEFEERGGSAYRGSPQHYAETADRSFLRERPGYRPEGPADTDWGAPPYTGGPGDGGGTYPVHIPGGGPESLAASSPDSSHLLGAAGLGLIGGIALAGVLAVFVFNSFVDENDQSGADVSPKVVERLSPAPAEPVREATGGSSAQSRTTSPRTAAVAPEQQPVIVQPQPSASAAPPQQASPLAAADASGAAATPISLDIKLGDVPGKDEALVSIKGLPTQAKLSTGIDVGGGQWLLPPSRLRDLTVTVPQGATGSYSLEVQLLKDDAQTSLTDPVAFQLSIGDRAIRHSSAKSQDGGVTSAANTEQAARLAALPDETPQIETDMLTQMLIRDGNKMMREGDIAGARRLYEQAAANGNPEAALAMGRSYDPSYFEKLPVKTGKPDPATAFEWYKKALEGGLVTARVKIDGLKQWLQH